MTTGRLAAAIGIALVSHIATAVAQTASPTLEKIKESGSITIGYRDGSIPMSYPGADQKPIGFGIELCSQVAAKAQQRLGLSELKITYKPVDPSAFASALNDGSVDLVCAAVPDTPEMGQHVLLTVPIYISEMRWITPRRMRIEVDGTYRSYSEWRTPASAQDLRGQTVSIIPKPGALALVLGLSNERTLGLSIINAKDQTEGFKFVEQGKAAAFLGDGFQLLGLKAASRNPEGFSFLDDSYPGTDYVFAMRKDDVGFKSLVDGAVTDAMRSGDYTKLYTKWFESPIPPKNMNLGFPMSTKLKQLVRELSSKASN